MRSQIICFLCSLGSVTALAAQPPIDFNRDIRPILSDKCFVCHGPDESHREADLRLDVQEEGGGWSVIIPGEPSESELIHRIESVDPDEKMPPSDSRLKLTEEEKELISSWVKQGANWKQHWAFVPVHRPSLPKVVQAQWPINGIDYFVLARLESLGLRPSPAASRETLIRRVTLDLTGLPPTPNEVEAFIDDRSIDAYEKVVDRLLSSERFGEHMAVMWLDAARYADTDGYQNDGPRDMWRWRDWVIDAYNSGMPFDQFTIEQLAGDLLPDASLDQKIATGFNRNHRYNSESGLVLEEFLLENAVDRVDTTSTVWMGLTMGCARCHDHKYDPLLQREYYQLISYFNNVGESGRAVKFGNSEPWVVAPTTSQQARLAKLDGAIVEARRALSQADAEIVEAQDAWETAVDSDVNLDAPLIANGLSHHFSFEGPSENLNIDQGAPVLEPGIDGLSATFDGQSRFALGEVGNMLCQNRASMAFWLRPDDVSDGVVLSRQAGGSTRPGVTVELRKGRLRFFIITRWIAGVGAVETIEKMHPDQWMHVAVTNDGSQSARGMKIFIDGKPAATRILFNTNSNTGGASRGQLRLGGGVVGKGFRGQVDDLRIYDRTLWNDEIEMLAVRESIAELRRQPAHKRSANATRKLRQWYLQYGARPEHQQLADNLMDARIDRLKYFDTLPTTMVMEEGATPRKTFVRNRGVYDQYADEVVRDVPAAFPPMPAEYPNNRLGFAKWLVDGNHPLTARVAVNRYWQRLFGTGIVKSAEDFGVQGDVPSHPELLDWLASEFVRIDWNMKEMQKLIVMSATYRQRSSVDQQLLEVDPDNRLLARGPRLRLTAHALRDQALFVSGLLVERLGGPSVSPYQPKNLWKEMSNMTYKQSKGEDLYRRSVYTIWKRTVAPPSLAILDAADRESCSVRAKRTNTPLQALTLLNEVTFVEAARRLGERLLRQPDGDPIRYGFRLVTARDPTPDELEILTKAMHEYRAVFKDDVDAAKRLISVGESRADAQLDTVELAACTAYCNLLLNLDEIVTRE